MIIVIYYIIIAVFEDVRRIRFRSVELFFKTNNIMLFTPLPTPIGRFNRVVIETLYHNIVYDEVSGS